MIRFIMRLVTLAFPVLVAFGAVAQDSQELTLERAVAIALEKNPLRKAALADQKIASAATNEARSMLLPKLMFSEAAMRGNDPVYVFGTRLRQQSFTPADFALHRLNTPTPIGNFTSRFSGQWSVFDAMQSWYSVSRAKLAQTAAGQQLDRTDQQLIFNVVRAYYGVTLAERQVETADLAVNTARAIEEHSRSRVTSGVTVSSDLLSAQVLAAQRQQEAIRARNGLALARTQFAIALGMSSAAEFSTATELREQALPLAGINELESAALTNRPDLKRLLTEESAQDVSVKMAKAAFAPRVSVFGSWQTDSRSLGWNGGNNWTAGAELQFDLFSGGSKVARLQREKATQERIAALRDNAKDQIRLEVRSSYFDLDAARQQVEVARAAVEQANESLRITQNRYESGLTTVTDLMRVEDAARRTRTDYWDALYRMHTSYAALELATGTLSPNSQVVKQ
ncbi:MAG TPA: TolC family protein [Terriglobales bacterium]|nr:TolC family protein [Terriglobales bacterium]